MTFRNSGNLDTSGVSGGGGGGRGRGVAIGGGVGGILVVLVAVVLGVDPSQLGVGGGTGYDTGYGSTGTDASAQAYQEQIDGCTLAAANTDTICRVVATTESLEDVWTVQLPEQTGMQYTQPHTNVFSGRISTGCGQGTSETGPFYCPSDNEVYLDPTFFDEVLVGQLGGSDSPASQMYVLAHEFGHHVQTLLGDIRHSQTDPRGASSGAVRVELQADCYAGLWAHYATTTPAPGGEAPLLESLTSPDVDTIVQTAEAIGDDHIQNLGSGRIDPSAWTHGSSEMRRQWFITGYQNGSVRSCDTFSAQL
ncbi:KPN_02809 family neutral zinc metallopeptidase [Dietzia sp.]|uniref:KPN_02809 family neutral zinc metallopeptidase n=1 Tax=Dietzia sp. TaxID=1871616 RepID=UPI002FD933A6